MSEETKKVMTVDEFCGMCKNDKYIGGKCIAYSPAGQERWLRMRGCSLGNVNLDAPQETKKGKINPLKASKRAKKGK